MLAGRDARPLWRVLVELLEHVLDLGELGLGLLDDALELLLGLLFGDVLGARVVLERAVVLDLLTRVLDLGEAEGGGRAFEEVAELAQRLEVLALLLFSAACQRVACAGAATGGSQVLVHLLEGAVGLAEEVKDDALAELAVDLVLVHLEDLLKGRRVDAVLCARDRHDALGTVLLPKISGCAVWRGGGGCRMPVMCAVGMRRSGHAAGEPRCEEGRGGAHQPCRRLPTLLRDRLLCTLHRNTVSREPA